MSPLTLLRDRQTDRQTETQRETETESEEEKKGQRRKEDNNLILGHLPSLTELFFFFFFDLYCRYDTIGPPKLHMLSSVLTKLLHSPLMLALTENDS